MHSPTTNCQTGKTRIFPKENGHMQKAIAHLLESRSHTESLGKDRCGNF